MRHLTNLLGIALLTAAYVQFFRAESSGTPPAPPAAAVMTTTTTTTTAATTEPAAARPDDSPKEHGEWDNFLTAER